MSRPLRCPAIIGLFFRDSLRWKFIESHGARQRESFLDHDYRHGQRGEVHSLKFP